MNFWSPSWGKKKCDEHHSECSTHSMQGTEAQRRQTRPRLQGRQTQASDFRALGTAPGFDLQPQPKPGRRGCALGLGLPPAHTARKGEAQTQPGAAALPAEGWPAEHWEAVLAPVLSAAQGRKWSWPGQWQGFRVSTGSLAGTGSPGSPTTGWGWTVQGGLFVWVQPGASPCCAGRPPCWGPRGSGASQSCPGKDFRGCVG